MTEGRDDAIYSPRTQKAAVTVAQRIARDIVRQQLEPGDRLDPEREMLAEFGVGRGTLREALRLLEFQGVLAMKPGPGGGPVVLRPSATHLADTFQLIFQLNHTPYSHVIEARTHLEPLICGLAADKISPARLTDLEESVLRMEAGLDDIYEFRESNRQFHRILAEASENALFEYLVESLLGILDGMAMGISYAPRRREAVLDAHRAILAAVARRDPAEARSLMHAHVAEHALHATVKFPEAVEQTIAWGSDR